MTEFIIRDYHEEDLPALVVHMKESVDGWPPGEFYGWDFTPEGIRNTLFKHKYKGIWVAAVGERIVGFLNYNAHYSEPDARYIPLLNVQPDFQGIGAGRDLLRAGVNRALEDGGKRLDLHTWAANMKAVPLYKKTGFFWRPRTEVDMYNFLPTVLRNPYVKRFLGDADWYPHLRQDLSVEESIDVVDGCHIQRYRFEKDGRVLEVWVDPSTSGVTALIGDEIDIRCLIAGEKHIAGMTYPVKWHFVNKGSGPANVALSCAGTKGVKYEFSEQFELTGEKTFETSATLASAIEPQREDWWGHPIDCNVTVDDMELGFRPGLRAVPPFELEIKPGPVLLAPCEGKRFTFNLKSRFPSDTIFSPQVTATGTVSITGGASRERINIPPEAGIGINATVKAGDDFGEGTIEIGGVVRSGGQEIEIKPLRVFARVAAKGQPVALKDENPKVTHLNNGAINITLMHNEGRIGFYYQDNGDIFLSTTGHSIGKPFSMEMDSTDHEVTTQEKPGELHAVMRGISRDFPGMALEQHVRLSTGGQVDIWQELVNEGEKPFKGRVRVSFGGKSMDLLTIPFTTALVEGNPNFWLTGNNPLPTDRLSYAEPWIAYKKDGRITGIIAEDFDTVSFGQWSPTPKYEWKVNELPPSGRISLPKVTIIPNAPSVEYVRQFALGENERSIDATPRRPIHMRAPVFCANDGKYPMAFHFARGSSVKAVAEAALPNSEICKTESEEWDVENPMRIELPIEGRQPGIVPVEYKIRTMSREERDIAPLVILPSGLDVNVTETEDGGFHTFIVDNGAYKYKISPKYCGMMRWWSEAGKDAENLIMTPFPETGEFTWLKPWYGGIELLTWDLGYRYYKSRFTGEPEEINIFGHKWKGVRVDISLLREYASLRMEAFYLTLPGAPVVMMLLRFTETQGGRRKLDFECGLYPRPGGSSQEKVFSCLGTDDGKATISQDGDGGDHVGRMWASTTDCATGRTIGLINPQGKAGIWDNCKEGQIPWWTLNVKTHPERPTYFTAFYCITDSPEQIELLAKELKHWMV